MSDINTSHSNLMEQYAEPDDVLPNQEAPGEEVPESLNPESPAPVPPSTQDFEDLKQWLSWETQHPPQPKTDYLLGILRRALAWAIDDLHDRLDPEIMSLVGDAHEVALDVTEDMLLIGRDARLQCISSSDMREICTKNEAIALLEAIREELKWVKEECERLRRMTHSSELFLAGRTRTSFAYWPTLRVHEEGRAGVEAGEVSLGELRKVMEPGSSTR